MRDFCYRVCYVLVRAAMFFWHPTLRVTGLENLPEGAAVLCANHAGAADPLWIIRGLNQPSLFRIMAKSELRKVPFVGWLMERFGMIFVRRGGHDTAAVEQCVQARAEEKSCLCFWRERAATAESTCVREPARFALRPQPGRRSCRSM